MVCSDAESGLANVYVGLGSSKREVDLVRWTAVNYTGAQVKLTVDVADGQATYTRVKVTNRGELFCLSFRQITFHCTKQREIDR